MLCIVPARSSIKEAIEHGYSENVVEAGTYNGHNVFAVVSKEYSFVYFYSYLSVSRDIYINGSLYRSNTRYETSIYFSAITNGLNLIEEKTDDKSYSTEYLIYNGIEDDTTCLTNKEYALVIRNAGVAYWEVSRDGGGSWEKIENTTIAYITSEAT